MSIICSTQVALRGISVALLVLGLQVTFSSESQGSDPVSDSARMATYDNAGETSFALSISPQGTDRPQRASDIVIYVDTSASQSGVYKSDSIATLTQMMGNLNAEDRVKIVAVDLNPIPLTDRFVSPASDEVAVAIENLKQRVALGSTDVELMLKTAAGEFTNSTGKNKNAIYIGDGISRAGILQTDAFSKSVNELVRNQISFSSFAIGPDRNIDLMAALANHTGGNVFLDSDDTDSTRNGSKALAQTVHGSVFWPQASDLSDGVVDYFPRQIPPLRTDRDTILVGTIADRSGLAIQISGIMDDASQTMSWNIQPEDSNPDFGFLTGLLRDARKDGGITLPTVGSAGLREYANVVSAESARLAQLGGNALSMGNADAARTLASAALKNDPANTTANVLAMAATYRVQDDNPFAQDGEEAPAAPAQETEPVQEVEPVQEPADDSIMSPPESTDLPTLPGQEQPGEAMVAPPVDDAPGKMTLIAPQDNAADQLLREAQQQSGGLILDEEQRIKIVNERAKKQVEFELKRHREELRTDPGSAINRLKNMIEVVDQTSDLYPDTRSELRFTLESALLSSRQRKLEFDDARAVATVNAAIGAQIEREAVRLERHEQEIAELVNKFNYLMEEGNVNGDNYAAAVEVTEVAWNKAPYNPAVVAAHEKARIARAVDLMTELRRQKANNFFESMYQTELASIPFPGNPVMVFPDAEEWRLKRQRRKKYEQIRLAGSANEEKILEALEEPANLAFDETPWSEVEEELEKQYKINIVLDQSAKDDSLTEDDPITINLTGIRFKNALRLMLKEKNATFIVRNEVLLIISLDDADDTKYFVTNVYNVGDLVAPRNNPQAGQLGLGGGGGGGGGLGGGGGGGGLGGGGGGQGGGGGVFCVQESGQLQLGNTSNPAPATKQQPQVIELPANSDFNTAWRNYFSANFAAPGDVRETVRHLMKQERPLEVVALIQAAIQHDQMQEWMYEAMVLSMQIAELPKSEVERALMSAVDLSSDPNDALYAAQYMATHGMEKRAIRMLKDFAKANPTRTEHFVVGLRTAQKIKDLDGIKWATVGIFSQEWPDHPEIVKQAQFASDAIRLNLKKQGRLEELAVYEADLAAAFERDFFIDVGWTGDADIDLYVIEPGGTICSRLQPRTTGGGVLMGDKYSQRPNESGVLSEQYVLPKGFAGDYQLLVRRVWGKVTSGKVTVAIHGHYQSEREVSLTKQVELDETGAIVLFSLDEGRRSEPLEEHAIETAVKQQLATNRMVLAQQVAEASYGSGSYYGGDGLAAAGGNPLLNQINDRTIGQGVVGYQPIITTIPQGTFLTINHATTADRLYVMVSPSPTFQQITSVENFNIFGDANTANQVIAGAGGAGGGGGGAGGGLGGGGGGAGGGAGGGVPSDLRYKKNITQLTSSLERVMKLRGVNYDWKINEFPHMNFKDENQVGFIAQELEDEFPTMVFTDESGYKTVDYSRLTPVLVEAVKELSSGLDAKDQQIAELKASLEAKNSQVDDLRSQTDELQKQMNEIQALLEASSLNTENN